MTTDDGSNQGEKTHSQTVSVAKSVEPGSALFYAIIVTRVSIGLSLLFTVIWWVNDFQPGHWVEAALFAQVIIGIAAFLIGLVLYVTHSPVTNKDVCDSCGSSLQGERGEDWVLTCDGCGKEWVYAGNNTYKTVESE